MKLYKRILIIFAFVIFFILFLNISVFAGTQKFNSLDYDITLNKDGSMDVVETWTVYVKDTNTLFKDFDIGNNNYKITNVKITQIEGNTEHSLKQIFVEQYHVDPNSYYGLKINNETFEIAWNVGLDDNSDNRIYKMY